MNSGIPDKIPTIVQNCWMAYPSIDPANLKSSEPLFEGGVNISY